MLEEETEPSSPTAEGGARRHTFSPRDAWFLFGAIFVIGTYHYLQALARVAPWIFPDEVRYTEFARAVAENGVPTVEFETPIAGALQSYLLAPAWSIDDPGTAWAFAKLTTVVAFCLTAVPVYFLARRFVSAQLAVLTGAAAILIPAAFYASTMMQEAFALPVATCVILLTVRIIERFSWWDVMLLLVLFAVGLGVRGQLAILPIAVAIALLTDAIASGARGGRFDGRRTLVGFGLLVLAAVAFPVGNNLTTLKDGWSEATHNLSTTVGVIIHSTGAMVICVAVIPALAFFVAPRFAGSNDRSRAALAASVIGFGVVFIVYTAIKSAAQGFFSITLIDERNLIYLEPLAIVAIPAVAARVRARGLLVPCAIVIGLIATLPITDLGAVSILQESPGLSWVWHLGQWWEGMNRATLAIILIGVTILAAFVLIRPRLGAASLVIATAALATVSGTLTYSSDHEFGRDITESWLPPDRAWIDRAAGDAQVAILLSNDIPDRNGLYLLSFWNRSLRTYFTVDGAPGPGIAGYVPTTDVAGSFPTGPAAFVLHPPAVKIDGTAVEVPESTPYRLTRIGGSNGQAQIASRVDGVAPDRWVGATFTVKRLVKGPAGQLAVDVSTQNPLGGKPRMVMASVGAQSLQWIIPRKVERTLRVPVPPGPFTVTFTLSPTDVGGPYDPRKLSLQVGTITFPGS